MSPKNASDNTNSGGEKAPKLQKTTKELKTAPDQDDRLPKFDPDHCLAPKMKMMRLRKRWNLLDSLDDDGHVSMEPDCADCGPECDEHLKAMKEMLRTGDCTNHRNPFGEDEREGFKGLFLELLKSEQN